MREIKFRGKRVDNGEWVYGDLVSVDYDYTRIKNDGCDSSLNKQYFIKEYAHTFIPVVTQEFSKERAEEHQRNYTNIKARGYEVIPSTIGQFTGLLDKNGKEIYEGDILKSTNKYKLDEISEGTVLFDDYQWFGVGDYLGYVSDNSVIEVIGNIHEVKHEHLSD